MRACGLTLKVVCNRELSRGCVRRCPVQLARVQLSIALSQRCFIIQLAILHLDAEQRNNRGVMLFNPIIDYQPKETWVFTAAQIGN